MSTEDDVRDVIEAQCIAWNNTDIQGFASYVHEDVVYVTPNGLVQGREKLLEAYRGEWKTKSSKLTVSVEQVMDHGESAAAVVRYWLSGGADPRSGWSLLHFVRTDLGWKLLADATMRSL
jgi:uncharacterized protein (TIGR02246 family)